jgi:putative ABC transport system permease protein
MDSLWKDLRFSLRTLRRSPLITAAAVLSLALGIGANTAIFSLVHTLLLEPVRVPGADRLVAVYTVDESMAASAGSAELPMSYANFDDFRRESAAFDHLVAVLPIPLSLSGEGPAERVPTDLVSEGYFEAMDVEPATGRFFRAEETAELGAAPYVVLSHDFWQRRFGGDDSVVGTTLRINGSPFEVVGVAPEGFTGFGMFTPQMWVPLSMREQLLTGPFQAFFDVRRALMLNVFGRLAPGQSRQAAQQRMTALAEQLAAEYPDANEGRGVTLTPIAQANVPPTMRGAFVRSGGVLMAVVGLVLLIACANVANLLLVRARGRRAEFGIRVSLGAPRNRLIRQLLLDGLLLSLAGGALGLLVARLTRDLLWGLRPPLLGNMRPDLGFDATVLAFTLGLAVATGCVFALAPIVQMLRLDSVSALKGARTSAAGGNRFWSLRNLLVVGQVALSLVALVGSALFLQSLGNLDAADPGFDADRLAVFSFDLAAAGYEPPRFPEFQRRAIESVTSLPGVESAAYASNRPMSAFRGVQRTVVAEGQATGGRDDGLLVITDVVSEGYHDTLGVEIVRGRDFEVTDQPDARPVAIVNQMLAERLWPGQDPLGKRLSFTGEDRLLAVVGVAADRKYNSLGEAPQPYVQLPMSQNPRNFAHLFLRTAAGTPEAALEQARRRVQTLDPEMPLSEPETLRQTIDASLWASRLGAVLLGIFGLLALVLTAVGIYGVISATTAQRRREIGIRVAMGAAPGGVMALVLRQGMTLVVAGILLGLAIGLVTFRLPLVADLLYGVEPYSPLAFAAAVLALVVIALLANLLPARRATTVDPVQALRQE